MTKEEIDSLCSLYGITNYTINEDMSISVNCSVNLSLRRLDRIPLKFKEVLGFFNCSYNKLESLEGCPERVVSYFHCTNAQLTSLEFCPKEIGGHFYCYSNRITSFDGLPEFFESYIDIDSNPVDEIYRLFNNDPKCIYWIKEFDVIQGNKVIRDRLEEVYVHMNMVMPKGIW